MEGYRVTGKQAIELSGQTIEIRASYLDSLSVSIAVESV